MIQLSINPPPISRECDCCGKVPTKKFGKAGDPLVGDFDGALLVKTFRTMEPKIKEYEDIIDLVKDWDSLFEKNKELAEQLIMYSQLTNTVGASWECRDCIILDTDEYFKLIEGCKQ